MITKNDIKFLKLAKVISTYSDFPRVKIGSVVVYKKSIVSVGCNKLKTNPEQLKYDKLLSYKKQSPKLHAEMDALLKAKEESYGATLYVFRRGRDGEYQICKPCAACMAKIKDSGIKRVVCTIYNGVKEIKIL